MTGNHEASMPRVRVFDSNAANPYWDELIGILEDGGVDVWFTGSADAQAPKRAGMLRPALGRTTVTQLVAEILSMLVIMFEGRKSVVVIVWARTYQKLLLLIARRVFGVRVLYVVHNPVASRWPSGWRGVIESWAVRFFEPLVHAPSLRASLWELTGASSQLVLHPPYDRWRERVTSKDVDLPVDGSSAPRFLLLGRVAPDKFADLDLLFEALGNLNEEVEVKILVRPRIQDPQPRSGFGPLLHVRNLSQDKWIPDGEIADALGWADVLLAPYEAVTESGTVHLAISCGVKVAAFRGGALDQTLLGAALAPVGNYAAFAATALRVHKMAHATVHDAEARREKCVESWLSVLLG